MNVFAADHPLVSQSPSWFDVKAHPRLSFVCATAVLAFVLAPFVLVRLYYYAISDIGAEPNPFPQPWLAMAVGCVVAFAVSVVPAAPVVLLYRLTSRRWRQLNAEPCAGGNAASPRASAVR
jgi:hypothetical protein